MVVPLHVGGLGLGGHREGQNEVATPNEGCGHCALRACVPRTARVVGIQSSLRACLRFRWGGGADAQRMRRVGVDKPTGKPTQYDHWVAGDADQQTLCRAAIDDHPHDRGTDDPPAHDHPHHRGTDDRPAHDHTHDRGTDDDPPADDDLERRIKPDHDNSRNNVEFVDTVGLDRRRYRSRCWPDRCPRLGVACPVSASSCSDMETGRQTGTAASDGCPRPPEWGWHRC